MSDQESTNPTLGKNPVDIISEGVSESWVKNEIKLAKGEVENNVDKMIRDQVQLDKASLITVFGIFASVISFLTIEFQFLKTICSLEKILGFTLILFSLLFGFNVALDYLIKSRLNKDIPKPSIYFTFLIIGLFLIGIIFTYKGNEEICVNNKIYQKYSDQFESNFELLRQELKQQNNEQDSKINSLETGFDKMKEQKSTQQ